MPGTAGINAGTICGENRIDINYISTVERGASFPRCEKLITIMNTLQVSADAIFCDVLTHSSDYKTSKLSSELSTLPPEAQNRILQMVELMIRQEKENK